MILWADFPGGSQGLYGSQASLLTNGVYAQFTGTLIDDPDISVGAAGRVFRSGQGQDTYLRRVFGGAFATVGVMLRLWMFGLPNTNSNGPRLQFSDSGNNLFCSVQVNSDGTLSIFKGPGSALLGNTAAPAMVANAWQHIEIKYVNALAGSVEIRVEGVPVFEFTGDTTVAGSSMNQFRINSSGAPTGFAIKDLAAWNGLGTEGNDFLGTCGVFYLPPNRDISTGWSRTTGATDFAILDNRPPDDAQYIFAGESPAIPAPSIVGFAGLPEDIVAVRALIPIMRARKSEGGEGKIQMSLLSGLDEDPGTDRAVSTAFTYWWDVSHTDPVTLAPWTPAAVDAVRLKINRTL